METTGSGSSILTQLLSELAEVFVKAEKTDDALAAAEEYYSEMVLLKNNLHLKYLELKEAGRLLEVRNETIRSLQASLNTARRVFGDSSVHGDRGPTRKNRPKLTPAEVGGIRAMVAGGSTLKSVAEVYGVHPSTVSRIVRGFYHAARGEE